MDIIKSINTVCPCCMEEHVMHTINRIEKTVFKGTPVTYHANYLYCDKAQEFYADERQLSSNDIAMKNAYRKKTGLLTSEEIVEIRVRYGISQSDLCLLLGWGAKTITRYESHQVQDIAHDTILRKLRSDPEWFLQLLRAEKNHIPAMTYNKYLETGTILFEQEHDQYLKSAIMSRYARFLTNTEATGDRELSLNAVVDMIHYYANSPLVTRLFLVKLMKMLWYADTLSYKRFGHAISGLVYRALPMGAVPVAYESIIDLSAIRYEEIEIGDGTGYRFLPAETGKYPYLSTDDKEVLDTVIQRFGNATKKEIVETMHREDAYLNTEPNDIIPFRYAATLSLS